MNEQQQRTLAAGLKALARTTQEAAASRRVEDVVLAEARRAPAIGTRPRLASSRRWLPLPPASCWQVEERCGASELLRLAIEGL